MRGIEVEFPPFYRKPLPMMEPRPFNKPRFPLEGMAKPTTFIPNKGSNIKGRIHLQLNVSGPFLLIEAFHVTFRNLRRNEADV